MDNAEDILPIKPFLTDKIEYFKLINDSTTNIYDIKTYRNRLSILENRVELRLYKEPWTEFGLTDLEFFDQIDLFKEGLLIYDKNSELVIGDEVIIGTTTNAIRVRVISITGALNEVITVGYINQNDKIKTKVISTNFIMLKSF